MYNIQDGHLDFSKLMRLDVTPSELAQYCLEPGDLLINRVNSRELVGKCAIVSAHHEPLVYEEMNIRVRLVELVNMPSYVNLVLRTKRVRELFQGDAKQAVGQASINQTQVGSVEIPLPPLAEQSRIVTRVAFLRRLCADLRQRLTALSPSFMSLHTCAMLKPWALTIWTTCSLKSVSNTLLDFGLRITAKLK